MFLALPAFEFGGGSADGADCNHELERGEQHCEFRMMVDRVE